MEERLQKILARAGVASRRAAETAIVEGRVTVNGETVTALGSKADAGRDDIRVDGVRVKAPAAPVYLLLNKPKGYVTTRSDPERRPTVMDLVPSVPGLFPVGRLDVTTEGLLILTNDGAFAERVAHPRYEVPRVYQAKVHKVPDAETIERLRRGVRVEGDRLTVDRVRVLEAENNAWLELTLHEGKHHEVRRLLEAVGHQVSKLRRVGIGPLSARGLKPGEFRSLTPAEVRSLMAPPGRRGTTAVAAEAPRRHPRPRRSGPARPAAAGGRGRRSEAGGRGQATGAGPRGPHAGPAEAGDQRRRGAGARGRPPRGRPGGGAASRRPPARTAVRRRGLVVAIDGPSGAGKSTAGRAVAERLGYVFLDTGAMYRALALAALRDAVPLEDGAALAKLARRVRIDLEPAGAVILDGGDVTGALRTQEVGAAASRISVHPAVRRHMVDRQREMGREGGVVMDGRDIGTAVFPDADIKFFVDAHPRQRAARRHEELAQRGVSSDLDTIEREIRARDHADSTRAESPLTRAADAIHLDTTELGLEEVVRRMLAAVEAIRPRAGKEG